MSKTKGNKIKSVTKGRGTLPNGVHLAPKLMVVAVALACGQAGAAPVSYDGNGGNWDAAIDWSTNAVPAPGADVTIDPTGAKTVTYRINSGTSTIGSLTMPSSNGTDTLSITGGILNVTNTFSAGANGTIVKIQGGTLNLNDASIGSFSLSSGTLGGAGVVNISGAATLTGGTMNGTGITNTGGMTVAAGAGTVTLDRTVNTNALGLSSGTLTGSGTVNAFSQTTLSGGTMSGAGITNAYGGVNLTGNTALNRTLNVAAATSFDIQGNNNVTGTTGTINNAGTFKKSSGTATSTIASTVTNTGTVVGQIGNVTFSKGVQGTTGTLQTSGGTLTLGAASTAKDLTLGTGTLALGANNVTVSGDYTNAGFGTGTAFNRKANVTGSGVINAAGASPTTFQQLSVDGGTTKTAAATTLALGNVHVGSSVSKDYQIYDMAGAGGVTLRGTIQGTGLNSQLSGSGVNVTTASWTAAAGATPTGVTKTVTFTGTTAGALAAGQQVTILNNFANTNQQTLGFTGAAYNLAAGSAAPTPITIATQRVGGTNAQLLTVSNTAPTGLFTEGLNASFGSNTGNATNNAGSISLLAGAAANNTAMSAGVNTATGGAKTGSVALNYVSDGTGTSGLANTSLTGQSINVSGNVYQTASAQLASPVNFGIVHVGDTASQNVAVTNIAPVAGLNDTLQGSLSGGGASFTSSGNFSGLGAQATNSGSLNVALDTTSAGSFSGNATAQLASHNAEMSNLALSSQSVGLSAQVNNYAKGSFADYSGAGSLSGSGSAFILDLGSILQGSGSALGSLYALNAGGSALFTDLMNGSFDTTGAFNFTLTGFGNFTDLAGGSGKSLSVALNDSTAGSFDQFVTLSYRGQNSSGYADAALTNVNLELRGSVVSPVPEPRTWAMLLVGLAVVSLRIRGMGDRASKVH